MTCQKLYIDEFGANTTPGVTIMDTARDLAFAAMGDSGDTLRFIPGTEYKFTTPGYVTNDNVTIDRRGAIINATEMELELVQNLPDAAFRVQGSRSLSTTLSGDAARLATTITVADATGVNIGDPVWLESSGELWYTSIGETIERQVINRVKAISGTTITLAWPLKMSFDATTYTVTVHFWDCVKNFTMLGGLSYGGGIRNDPDNPGTYVGNGKGAGDLVMEYVDGAKIEIEYLEGFQGIAISPKYCMDVDISGGTIRGHDDDYTDPVTGLPEVENGRNSGFYGVFFFDCYGGSLKNTTSHRTRHHQDASSSANILVEGNRAYRNQKGPFGSHSGADDFTFIGNESEQADAGIVWRGQDFKAIGNTFNCLDGAASAIYDSSGAAADIPKSYTIMGNTLRGARYALFVEGNIGSLRSSGNHYENAETGVVYAPVGLSTLDMNSASFVGDYFTTAADNCLYAQDTTPRTRGAITVSNCTFTGYAARPARFFDTQVINYHHNTVDAGDAITHDSTDVVNTEANYGVGGETA